MRHNILTGNAPLARLGVVGYKSIALFIPTASAAILLLCCFYSFYLFFRCRIREIFFAFALNGYILMLEGF